MKRDLTHFSTSEVTCQKGIGLMVVIDTLGRYVPSFIPPGLAAMVNKEKDSDKRSQREDDKNKDRDRGKSRNIDHFMEELKREQEAREKRSLDRESRREGRVPRITGSAAADLAIDNVCAVNKQSWLKAFVLYIKR
jgi:hypothetical protein